jgi:tRNA (cytidine/uridine-2'-O-)-methyltransferase
MMRVPSVANLLRAMRLVLFQPDIPQNAGAIMRLGACLAVPVHVIDPCGFVWDDARIRRAGMDYRDLATVTRHRSWNSFLCERPEGRLLLLTTAGETSHLAFSFQPGDFLILGRESAGAPAEVHAAAAARLRVPMAPRARSLNVAMTAALVVGEALRQTGQIS